MWLVEEIFDTEQRRQNAIWYTVQEMSSVHSLSGNEMRNTVSVQCQVDDFVTSCYGISVVRVCAERERPILERRYVEPISSIFLNHPSICFIALLLPWGHSGPVCHALSLSSLWTSKLLSNPKHLIKYRYASIILLKATCLQKSDSLMAFRRPYQMFPRNIQIRKKSLDAA